MPAPPIANGLTAPGKMPSAAVAVFIIALPSAYVSRTVLAFSWGSESYQRSTSAAVMEFIGRSPNVGSK